MSLSLAFDTVTGGRFTWLTYCDIVGSEWGSRVGGAQVANGRFTWLPYCIKGTMSGQLGVGDVRGSVGGLVTGWWGQAGGMCSDWMGG